MIKKWLQKRKLVSLIKELATYNDKGISWRLHNEEQVKKEHRRLLDSIKNKIDLIGLELIPKKLIQALESGKLKTDLTGKYIKYAKQTKL